MMSRGIRNAQLCGLRSISDLRKLIPFHTAQRGLAVIDFDQSADGFSPIWLTRKFLKLVPEEDPDCPNTVRRKAEPFKEPAA
jgi:hypothetical protein